MISYKETMFVHFWVGFEIKIYCTKIIQINNNKKIKRTNFQFSSSTVSQKFIMAGPMPTNMDLLEHIKKSHPGIGIKHSDYKCNAKTCLHEILERSGISCTEDELSYTARRFVEYVRELWRTTKYGSNFKSLKKSSYFKLTIVLRKESVPDVPTPPQMPPKPPPAPRSKRKTYDELCPRQQDRVIANLREHNHSNAIIDAAVKHFRSIKANDAAYVMKRLKDDPEELGTKLRKFITQPPHEMTRVSNVKALAYILDRGMTKIDYETTCNLVNEPGHYILPCYSLLDKEKANLRPSGKLCLHFAYIFAFIFVCMCVLLHVWYVMISYDTL